MSLLDKIFLYSFVIVLILSVFHLFTFLLGFFNQPKIQLKNVVLTQKVLDRNILWTMLEMFSIGFIALIMNNVFSHGIINPLISKHIGKPYHNIPLEMVTFLIMFIGMLIGSQIIKVKTK